jgi:uncharacterized glyoxalase superfamily protein PhnB
MDIENSFTPQMRFFSGMNNVQSINSFEVRAMFPDKKYIEMEKLDTIIAVKDVDSSANWYSKIFGFTNASLPGHGFAVLKSPTGEIVLLLHQWEMDHHPTLEDATITAGNGLLLYFRTDKLQSFYEKAKAAGCIIEEDIHVNPKSGKREFAFRDPDGYYLVVSDFHEFDN